MTKEELSLLDIEEQINYFNEQMALGKSAFQVNKDLGYNEATTRKKFAKNGYKLNPERTRYILVGQTATKNPINSEKAAVKNYDDKGMTAKNTNLKPIDDRSHTSVTTQKTDAENNFSKENIPDDKSMTKVISKESNDALIEFNDDDKGNTFIINNELKKNLLKLSENYPDIEAMLTWFKNRDDKSHTNVIEIINGLSIDLPDSENIRTTVRINKKVWDEFNDFCDTNSQFNKQDLHAMALKEYIEKHK